MRAAALALAGGGCAGTAVDVTAILGSWGGDALAELVVELSMSPRGMVSKGLSLVGADCPILVGAGVGLSASERPTRCYMCNFCITTSTFAINH